MMLSFTGRILCLFLLLIYFDGGGCGATDKVLLRDVNAITLRDGQYTTGRRSAPVPQLKCVGGSAKGQYKPRVVQCVKQGFDGIDYQWKCTADMPHEFEFGEVTVTCEGYDYPEDPYILKGSCGLEYDLEYTNTAYAKKDVSRTRKSNWWSKWSSWLTQENLANAVVAAFILYVIYAMFFANTTTTPGGPRPPRYGWFGSGYDGGPGYPGGGGGHPPPSAPPPPPSYDDAMGYKSTSHSGSASGSSGPGFWTGAGLGALGGYLFGRNSAPSYSAPYGGLGRSRNERFMRDTGFVDSYADQPSTSRAHDSSEMHESTGYGGTRRR